MGFTTQLMMLMFGETHVHKINFNSKLGSVQLNVIRVF